MKTTRVSLYVIGCAIIVFSTSTLILNGFSYGKKIIIQTGLRHLYGADCRVESAAGGFLTGVSINQMKMLWKDSTLIESLSAKSVDSNIYFMDFFSKNLPETNVLHLNTMVLKLRRILSLSLEDSIPFLKNIPDVQHWPLQAQEGPLHLKRNRLIWDNLKRATLFTKNAEVRVTQKNGRLDALKIFGQTPRSDHENKFYFLQKWDRQQNAFDARIVIKDYALTEFVGLSPRLNILDGTLDALIYIDNGGLKKADIEIRGFKFRWMDGKEHDFSAHLLFDEGQLMIKRLHVKRSDKYFSLSGHIKDLFKSPYFNLNIALHIDEGDLQNSLIGPYDSPQIKGSFSPLGRVEQLRWDFSARELFFSQTGLIIEGMEGQFWYKPFTNPLRLQGDMIFTAERVHLHRVTIGNFIVVEGLIRFFPEDFLLLNISLPQKMWKFPWPVPQSGWVQGNGTVTGSFTDPEMKLDFDVSMGLFNSKANANFSKGVLQWSWAMEPLHLGSVNVNAEIAGDMNIGMWLEKGFLPVRVYTKEIRLNEFIFPRLDASLMVDTHQGDVVVHHIQIEDYCLIEAQLNVLKQTGFMDLMMQHYNLKEIKTLFFKDKDWVIEGDLTSRLQWKYEPSKNLINADVLVSDGRMNRLAFKEFELELNPLKGDLRLHGFGFGNAGENDLKIVLDMRNPEGIWEANIQAQDLSLGAFLIKGNTHAQGSFSLRDEKKSIFADLAMRQLVINGVAIENIVGALFFDIEKRFLNVTDLKIGEMIKINGQIDFSRNQLDMRFDINHADVEMLGLLTPQEKNDALKGKLKGQLRLFTDLYYPRWEGRLDVYQGKLFKYVFDHAFFNIRGTGPFIDLKNSRILQGIQQLEVEGVVNLVDPRPFKDVKFSPIHSGIGSTLPVSDPAGYLREAAVRKPIGERWVMSVKKENFSDNVQKQDSRDGIAQFELEYAAGQDNNLVLRMDEQEGMLGLKKKLEF